MSTATPLSIYQEFQASLLARDNQWQDLLADDVRLYGPLEEAEGKSAFIQTQAAFYNRIQNSTQHKIAEAGDFVITQITTILQTGKQTFASLYICEWYEIRDGKIQTLQVYFDPTPMG